MHASSPTSQLVPAGPWSSGLAAATQDRGSGTTVQSCQASRLAGQVTCFGTRLHIFLPKGPSASLPLLPRAWLFLIYSLRVYPSLSFTVFSLFPSFSLKNKRLLSSTKLKLFSLPLKFLSNFSRTHLYSCHVLLPSFTAEIFIKLFLKHASSFTSPFSFSSTVCYIAKSSLFPWAE